MSTVADDDDSLLKRLAEHIGRPAERIRATAAWRDRRRTGDSLDAVELAMEVGAELDGDGG